MAIQMINRAAAGTLSKEKERIELVVYFGRKFDRYAQKEHWRMLLVLAAWAESHQIEYCADKARRAAHKLMPAGNKRS